jgi:hypothetical protein
MQLIAFYIGPRNEYSAKMILRYIIHHGIEYIAQMVTILMIK